MPGSTGAGIGREAGAFSVNDNIKALLTAVAFAIAVAPGMEAAFGPAREQAVAVTQKLAGTRKVMVSLTGGKPPAGPKFSHGSPAPAGKSPVPGIRRIIRCSVASVLTGTAVMPSA